jgi:hypothetical protein
MNIVQYENLRQAILLRISCGRTAYQLRPDSWTRGRLRAEQFKCSHNEVGYHMLSVAGRPCRRTVQMLSLTSSGGGSVTVCRPVGNRCLPTTVAVSVHENKSQPMPQLLFA